MTKKKNSLSKNKKTTIRISLDQEIITALRKSGDGWQERLNDLVKAALALTHVGK